MNLLTVVSSYNSSNPEAIRHRNVLHYLKKRYTVHVLCIGEKYTRYKMDGVTIHEIPNSLLGRLRNTNRLVRLFLRPFRLDPIQYEVWRLRKKVSELIKSENIDLVIGSAAPFGSLMIGEICHRGGIPFIYDTCDPCYMNAVFGSFKNRFAYLYEKKYLPYVNELIVTNEETRNLYLEHFGNIFSPEQVSVITMGAALHALPEKKESGFPVRMIYAGNFYKDLRNPTIVFQAIETFSEPVELDVYTSYSRFTDHQQSKVNFFERISHEQLYHKYEETDIVLFLDNAYGVHTPGKLFEVLSLKRPVLFVGGRNTPSKKIAEGFNHAFIASNDVNSLQMQLKRIIESYPEIQFDDKNLEPYSWENIAVRFERIVGQLKE